MGLLLPFTDCFREQLGGSTAHITPTTSAKFEVCISVYLCVHSHTSSIQLLRICVEQKSNCRVFLSQDHQSVSIFSLAFCCDHKHIKYMDSLPHPCISTPSWSHKSNQVWAQHELLSSTFLKTGCKIRTQDKIVFSILMVITLSINYLHYVTL